MLLAHTRDLCGGLLAARLQPPQYEAAHSLALRALDLSGHHSWDMAPLYAELDSLAEDASAGAAGGGGDFGDLHVLLVYMRALWRCLEERLASLAGAGTGKGRGSSSDGGDAALVWGAFCEGVVMRLLRSNKLHALVVELLVAKTVAVVARGDPGVDTVPLQGPLLVRLEDHYDEGCNMAAHCEFAGRLVALFSAERDSFSIGGGVAAAAPRLDANVLLACATRLLRSAEGNVSTIAATVLLPHLGRYDEAGERALAAAEAAEGSAGSAGRAAGPEGAVTATPPCTVLPGTSGTLTSGTLSVEGCLELWRQIDSTWEVEANVHLLPANVSAGARQYVIGWEEYGAGLGGRAGVGSCASLCFRG